jgi:hypothetical protein
MRFGRGGVVTCTAAVPRKTVLAKCHAPVVRLRPERPDRDDEGAALRSGDFAHGVVEGQAEDFDEEVDGVAGAPKKGVTAQERGQTVTFDI